MYHRDAARLLGLQLVDLQGQVLIVQRAQGRHTVKLVLLRLQHGSGAAEPAQCRQVLLTPLGSCKRPILQGRTCATDQTDIVMQLMTEDKWPT